VSRVSEKKVDSALTNERQFGEFLSFSEDSLITCTVPQRRLIIFNFLSRENSVKTDVLPVCMDDGSDMDNAPPPYSK
jgi:hypothetical protein